MPSRRSRFLRSLATFAVAAGCLSTTTASAQSGNAFQRYSERFYGQNFYDHQRGGLFGPYYHNRQYASGFYGPAMMYSRQYVDEAGYARPRRLAPFASTDASGYGSYSNPR